MRYPLPFSYVSIVIESTIKKIQRNVIENQLFNLYIYHMHMQFNFMHVRIKKLYRYKYCDETELNMKTTSLWI
jgi:hypothetical protein